MISSGRVGNNADGRFLKAPMATPMLKQYLSIKEQYNDTILFYRLGDFYEMFFEDAQIASKLLDITLTSRNKNNENPVPLCGVPYHSVEPYIAKLLENGKKVAICEQIEDPKLAKGVVKRAVTRIYTPGVMPDGSGLDAAANNFVAAVIYDRNRGGFAYADISTGLFRATAVDSMSDLLSESARIEPKEILIMSRKPDAPPLHDRGADGNREPTDNLEVSIKTALPSALITHIDFPTQAISASFIENNKNLSPEAKRAADAVYAYLSYTQQGNVSNIHDVEFYTRGESMRLDDSTKRNLEILRTIHSNETHGSLLWLVNRTKTAMGARLLKEWLISPLTSRVKIEERHAAVDRLKNEPFLAEKLSNKLDEIADLERLAAKTVMGTGNARDMRAIAVSLSACADIKAAIDDSQGFLKEIADGIDPMADQAARILAYIVDTPPLSTKDGGMIRDGVNSELDELRSIQRDCKSSLARMETDERARTGIGSLKVRYNRVFGYYIEITNAHKDKTPENYIRKQTLANAERFITPELKEFEDRVLGAEDRIKALEFEIFSELRSMLSECIVELAVTAKSLARLDVISSFAVLARENRYCRPEMADDELIEIEEGRHPVVEKLLTRERFVPNDIKIGDGSRRLLMITGPNMAGKSTVMRQTAIIVLMAQIGSFVPAARAHIGIADRIFTRIGASDALAKGESTFMVEMREAATILKEATQKSLIIIDEIGRGTSTFDGLAIAWAIAEELHDRVRARTLFATHYHELTELAVTREGIKNFQIAVKEWNDQVIFLRRLVPGGTSHSYGIQVAGLAGLPDGVIARSREILGNLENGEFDEIGRPRIARGEASTTTAAQMALFTANKESHPVVENLREADLSTITPLEALNLLHRWKQSI